ncbi:MULTISPECIES: LacI family DNA-binding transcriptional regulator [Rahnella]|jgi:DNA-binding LacI/PurR family transcriptional regulator|uniref:LacI family DNA-binding transcriptional regulator n=1 Tax=Rahnella contaminans TaxID=2703882 RepID=A0A6M2B2F1_9GAMM|nr:MULTISPECIES: LacI family DNA-binding transcriptional regulator [Rahnella]KAB8311113.1 LacI family DNA-binding transcriptional regulator [Rouxiella chamberiensis]MBF7996327.1 LacI family DNA-binding transcriptional regulator [Rahnella laticis]MBU9822491.1 LacI family DNA-binding transcriptional regulator [Rahnella sp. BCC 1045]MBV6816841.1 LacI family DNA-binding transcriptional regulator [Rahnella sp. PD12R]MDF1894542.1 LacI family DNA-binding transcriptional regulator [Rahnella contaminan
MSINKKRRSTGRVTLADVAQLAGVGSMTVSRALRTPEQVSDKLREKIEEAVSQLGYLPNQAASSLASASSNTIAMIVPSLSESGCAEMFAGLQKVLQPAGYQIMLAESQHRIEREEKLLETLLSYNLAAAILLSVEHSANVRQWLDNLTIPVLEIGALTDSPIDMNIGIDYVEAMFQLTQTVVAKGYQNIGMLCANQEQWIFQQHLQGWRKAMLKAHMSPHRVINAAEPACFSTGAQQLPEFLLAWPEIDALVCVSDDLACGALYECQRRRIKVPDDLAVVGFGNADVSKVCQPPLTTIAIPHKEIGIRAAQALLARINDEEWEEVTIASSLCKRDSC